MVSSSTTLEEDSLVGAVLVTSVPTNDCACIMSSNEHSGISIAPMTAWDMLYLGSETCETPVLPDTPPEAVDKPGSVRLAPDPAAGASGGRRGGRGRGWDSSGVSDSSVSSTTNSFGNSASNIGVLGTDPVQFNNQLLSKDEEVVSSRFNQDNSATGSFSNDQASSSFSSVAAAAALQPPAPPPTPPFLSTGCPVLDSGLFSGRGLTPGMVTELCGEAGCGKTQLSLQMCLQVQLPSSAPMHGLDGAAFFISTEGNVAVDRLRQLQDEWQHRYPWCSTHDFGSHVYVENVADLAHLKRVLFNGLPRLLDTQPIRLVVIDSIAAVMRLEFDTSSGLSNKKGNQMARRAAALFEIGAQLQLIAGQYDAVVLVINQVSDVMDRSGPQSALASLWGGTSYGDGADSQHCQSDGKSVYSNGRYVKPALGLSWANCINSRILLSRNTSMSGRQLRSMQLAFAPHLPQAVQEFDVFMNGVHGIGCRLASSEIRASPVVGEASLPSFGERIPVHAQEPSSHEIVDFSDGKAVEQEPAIATDMVTDINVPAVASAAAAAAASSTNDGVSSKDTALESCEMQSSSTEPIVDWHYSPNCRVWHQNSWMNGAASNALMLELEKLVQAGKFTYDYYRMPSGLVKSRRTVLACSDGFGYSYAGQTRTSMPWETVPGLLAAKAKVEAKTSELMGRPIVFNYVLINYYANGCDVIADHADDQGGMDGNAPVVSLTLAEPNYQRSRKRQRTLFGQEVANQDENMWRVFWFRDFYSREIVKRFYLDHGALLIMFPGVQSALKHGLPERKKHLTPRFNLTFRVMKESERSDS